jgi:hypothetical protein
MSKPVLDGARQTAAMSNLRAEQNRAEFGASENEAEPTAAWGK